MLPLLKTHLLARSCAVDINFEKAPKVGTALQAALDYVRRDYKTENPFIR